MRQIMGRDLFVSADFSALRKSPEEPNDRGKDRECESESMQWQQPAQVARTRTAANGSKVLLMQRVQSHINIVDTTQYISRLRCTSNMVSKDSKRIISGRPDLRTLEIGTTRANGHGKL